MNAEFRSSHSTNLILDELEIAPENPRSDETVDAVAVAHLADSIEAIGVLTPLIAYANGPKWFVTAGGRRLRALRLLVEEGRRDSNDTIPVSVMDPSDAVDAGDAEQLTHQIMSDLDTIKVFARPEYAKYSDAQLAKLVGRSPKYVTQRRAILDLPDEAKAALYDGNITVSQAAGLTYWVSDDEGFADALDSCMNNRHVSGDDLRRSFERRCRPWSDHAMTKLVTVEEYRAAGGRLQGDLFADDQFILSPDVLELLAKGKAQKIVEERFPSALTVVHDSKLPDEYRTHPGIDTLTDDEAEEWSDIRYDFSSWQHENGSIQEDIDAEEDEAEKVALQALYDRWKELREKAERFYPDELSALLVVSYSLRPYGDDPIFVRENIIPWTTLERRKLEALGYIDAPKPQNGVEENTDAAQGDVSVSAALAARIKRIKAHCVRQDMMKRPNDVLEEFLVHIAVPSYYESHFSYRPEPSEHLGIGDPSPICGSAWDKAHALDSETEEALRGLKPADQRTVLAMRILNCLRSERLPMDVTPAMLRDYVALDADFFKAYKKNGMIDMLARVTGRPETDFENQKASGLAQSLESLFADEKDWLPNGF